MSSTQHFQDNNNNNNNHKNVPWSWIRAVRDIVENNETVVNVAVENDTAVRNNNDSSSSSSTGSDHHLIELVPWLYISGEHRLYQYFKQPPVVPFNSNDSSRSTTDDVTTDPPRQTNNNKNNSLGITHVLTTNLQPQSQLDKLTKTLHDCDANIRHKYIPGKDHDSYNYIQKHWQECLEFLQEARQSNPNNKVLVHCLAGMNRSGLVACAAIMVLERRNVLEVVQMVHAKRNLLLLNRYFQKQLCELAQTEQLLGGMPPNSIKYPNEPFDEKEEEVFAVLSF